MSNVPTLGSSAMLVDVSMSVWTAHKLDKAVTAEVNSNKHAQAGVARVNKNLFKDVKQLEDIKRLARETHAWVNANTLPWSDAGPRLLPTTAFFGFKQELNDREDEFEQLVQAFMTSYATLISAQAFKLGSMFRATDYPTPQQVASKFAFNTDFTPLPSAGDFRVDIGHEAMDELKAQYEDTYTTRFDTAVQDIRERLLNSIRHLSERLEYEDNGKKKVFKDSTLQNIADMLQQVKVLNISGDEALEAARYKAEQVMSWTSAKELREEDGARENTRRDLNAILAKFAI